MRKTVKLHEGGGMFDMDCEFTIDNEKDIQDHYNSWKLFRDAVEKFFANELSEGLKK